MPFSIFGGSTPKPMDPSVLAKDKKGDLMLLSARGGYKYDFYRVLPTGLVTLHCGSGKGGNPCKTFFLSRYSTAKRLELVCDNSCNTFPYDLVAYTEIPAELAQSLLQALTKDRQGERNVQAEMEELRRENENMQRALDQRRQDRAALDKMVTDEQVVNSAFPLHSDIAQQWSVLSSLASDLATQYVENNSAQSPLQNFELLRDEFGAAIDMLQAVVAADLEERIAGLCQLLHLDTANATDMSRAQLVLKDQIKLWLKPAVSHILLQDAVSKLTNNMAGLLGADVEEEVQQFVRDLTEELVLLHLARIQLTPPRQTFAAVDLPAAHKDVKAIEPPKGWHKRREEYGAMVVLPGLEYRGKELSPPLMAILPKADLNIVDRFDDSQAAAAAAGAGMSASAAAAASSAATAANPTPAAAAGSTQPNALPAANGAAMGPGAHPGGSSSASPQYAGPGAGGAGPATVTGPGPAGGPLPGADQPGGGAARGAASQGMDGGGGGGGATPATGNNQAMPGAHAASQQRGAGERTSRAPAAGVKGATRSSTGGTTRQAKTKSSV